MRTTSTAGRTILSVLLLLCMLLSSCAKPAVPNDSSQGASSPATENSSALPSNGEESGSSAAVSSEEPYDPAEYPVVDMSTVQEEPIATLPFMGGYNGTFRVKSSGELLLSPFIGGPEGYDGSLREYLAEKEIDETTSMYVMLTFTLLDENGVAFYAYEPVQAHFGTSKGQFFDIWLQGEDLDCGFCPTAGRLYHVNMDLYATEEGLFEGVGANARIGRVSMRYQMISTDYQESPYYRPTEIPAEANTADLVTLTYMAGEGGRIEGISMQGVARDGKGSAKVTAVANEGYIFIGWNDGKATASRFGDLYPFDYTFTANFMKLEAGTGVATMMINTEYGEGITDTENYRKATVKIMGASKDKFNVTVTTQIRGRGNSSFNGWTWADNYDGKNSYRLKFDEKIRLLGVGDSKNRDWVLNANKFDVSGLRNYAVWQLAAQMGSIDYVPSCTWVQLYLNGDYRGLYMVCEFVETGADRVNVQGLDNTEDPGFLVELDFRGKSGKKDVNYFMLSNFDAKRENQATPFVVKSDNASETVTPKIKAFMQKCNDALITGDKAKIEALIDLDSFVDMFIIEELAKDCDMGGASMFFYRDAGGKLHFTAPWDFDFGFGTYGPSCSVYDLCTGGGEHNNVWMERLLKTEWFRKLLTDRMNELKNTGVLENMLGKVRVQGKLLTEASDKNDERWGVYGNDYHEYVSWQVSGALENYEAHVNYLIDYIRQRWEILYGCVDQYEKYGGSTPEEFYNYDFNWDDIDWNDFLEISRKG